MQNRHRCPQYSLGRQRGGRQEAAELLSDNFAARVSSLEQSTAASPHVQAEGPEIDPTTGQAIPGRAKTAFNIVFVSSEVPPRLCDRCSLPNAASGIPCGAVKASVRPAARPQSAVQQKNVWTASSGPLVALYCCCRLVDIQA